MLSPFASGTLGRDIMTTLRSATRALGAFALVLAACGGAAPTQTATATSTPTPSAATAAAGAQTWTIGSASKATVSVREQLVGISFPSDAVLVAKGGSGTFTINADGSFSPDSKITFDLTTLASDQRQRDDFVKQSVLQTRQFPTATFVPVKAAGVALPIASDTELKFQISGKITIHNTTKDVTFDVVATRSGGQLTATATASPTWKFGDFGMQPPAVPGRVLSVVDEIHLVVDLVATGAGA
jgi:polyisoprenoid-binding protein YceI